MRVVSLLSLDVFSCSRNVVIRYFLIRVTGTGEGVLWRRLVFKVRCIGCRVPLRGFFSTRTEMSIGKISRSLLPGVGK